MRGTFIAFFLWLSLPKNIYSQVFVIQDPQLYINKVAAGLWKRVQNHGLSNFAVPGHKINYNVSAHGIDLIGDVVFEDGFVMDLTSVASDNTQLRTSVIAAQAAVMGRMDFRVLEIVEDFRADFPAGMTVGTVILRPERFSYAITISKNFTSNAIVSAVSLGTFGEPTWEIFPDNPVTVRIRRYYTQQNLGNGNIIGAAYNAWMPILKGFLDEIVTEIGFPDLV